MALPNLPQAGGFRGAGGFSFLQRALPSLDLGNWASEKYVISEPVIDESTPEDSRRMPMKNNVEPSASAAPPLPAASAHQPNQREPRFALFIATAGGLGYLPVAPGTWGSLLGVL